MRIWPYHGHSWREVGDNANPLLEIVDWPHEFRESPNRWTERGTEHPDYGGCLWCGASELSRIHLVTP